MTNALAAILKWFANPRIPAAQADPGPARTLPEHEQRLHDMEKSGRILFLP